MILTKAKLKSVWKQWTKSIRKENIINIYGKLCFLLMGIIVPTIITAIKFFTYGINTLLQSSSCNLLVEKFTHETKLLFAAWGIIAIITGLLIVPLGKLAHLIILLVNSMIPRVVSDTITNFFDDAMMTIVEKVEDFETPLSVIVAIIVVVGIIMLLYFYIVYLYTDLC